MLNFRNVTLRRGPEPLVEGATLSIFRGDKVGIVGRNGCGKSTLLALIRGDLAADAGDFEMPDDLATVWVAQEVPHSSQAVVEYVIDGDLELRALERQLEAAAAAGDGLRQANLLHEFDRLGGYSARSRAASLLDGLGFQAGDIDRPLLEFSGGLRMRANLARALMRRSDLLLLDEPTNHLDLDAVLWLEVWLRAYPGTLLLVSHDREFLDAIVGRILHFENRRVTTYTGNYSAFEVQHAEQRAQSAAANARLAREAAHVQSFIDRFRAKASKARQAQSRIKWLERLPRIIEMRDESTFQWEFAEPRKLPQPLVTLENVAGGYGDRRIIERVRLSIAPQARIGILGRNGAGKSTLMKIIAGEIDPLGGQRTPAPDLEVGFFAQLELEQLDVDSTALLELTRRGGAEVAAWNEQKRRDHLGQFGFRGDRVFEPVAQFSGGERARLSLAILVARRPNLLLLDEPTNHLDFEMRESLLLAIQEFGGAVVTVSHDRALLRGVCDEFLLVGDGGVTAFDGDLEDYASWLGKRQASAASADPADSAGCAGSTGAPGASRRESGSEARRRSANARQKLAPLRRELQQVETELATLGSRRQALELRLADPEFYSTASAAAQRDAAMEHARLGEQIDTAETRWLELTADLEAGAQSED